MEKSELTSQLKQYKKRIKRINHIQGQNQNHVQIQDSKNCNEQIQQNVR